MVVRVLIVDDSPFVREVLREGLSRFADIEVVGEAPDGKRAEQMVMELRPDVVTMDVVMPMVGGMEAIKTIMARCPTPIVVVSDVQNDHRLLSLEAMEAGALDTFAKPRTGFDEAAADKLASLRRAAARTRVTPRPRIEDPETTMRKLARLRPRAIEFVGVVASTGGPQTLRRFLQELTRQRGALELPPITVVQHTAVGFAGALSSWLDRYCDLEVLVARDGQRVAPGTVAIAPDDQHLEIAPGGIARLSRAPKIRGHRPSGTMLLSSLARSFGATAAGVVLTGMGNDGARGAQDIEEQGGLLLIEDPRVAIIDGMPRAALGIAHAPIVGPADQLARMIIRLSRSQGRR